MEEYDKVCFVFMKLKTLKKENILNSLKTKVVILAVSRLNERKKPSFEIAESE